MNSYLRKMVIKSHAAPDEVSSPFYIANQEFCREFERFVASKNGLIKGSYNAYSYDATGKIPHQKEWILKCNKGTYASSGNLFLSAKKQCLRVTSTWIALNLVSDSLDFEIQKKTFYHALTSNWTPLSHSSPYSIQAKQPNSKLLLDLTYILDGLLKQEKIMEITYVEKELRIEINSEELHSDIIDKLLNL
jgi:hypothetical protein